MLRVYIAGPITNTPNYDVAFREAATLWRLNGWVAINPVEIDDTTHKPHYIYMRQDIAVLITCDAIATLPGWNTSEGALAEVAVAAACNIPRFDALYPGKYVTHLFIPGYNACCTQPRYAHESDWNSGKDGGY